MWCGVSMSASPVVVEGLWEAVLALGSHLLSNSRIGPAAACGHSLGMTIYVCRLKSTCVCVCINVKLFVDGWAGCWLLRGLYEALPMAVCRQGVVAGLVAHAVSPSSKEGEAITDRHTQIDTCNDNHDGNSWRVVADAAFSVLSSICSEEHDELLRHLQRTTQSLPPPDLSSCELWTGDGVCVRTFASFLKSLLGNLRALSEEQVRALFRWGGRGVSPLLQTHSIVCLSIRRMLFQCAIVQPSLLPLPAPRSSSSTTPLPAQTLSPVEVEGALATAPVDDLSILLKKLSASPDIK